MHTLVIPPREAGLFSNLNRVMAHLRFDLGRDGVVAIEPAWTPIATMRGFAYGGPQDGNVWLKLFEPLPSDPRSTERRLAHELFPDQRLTGTYAFLLDASDPDWRLIYNRLYGRFIRPRPDILRTVDTILAGTEGRRLVGAHYRHPSHAVEMVSRRAPPTAVFIERIRARIAGDAEARVVLATDIETAVSDFREAFGDRLIVQPGVARARDAGDTALHEAARDPGIELARQALIDGILLSRCEILFHVPSNVSTAVGYINPKLVMVNCEERSFKAWRRTLNQRRRVIKYLRRNPHLGSFGVSTVPPALQVDAAASVTAPSELAASGRPGRF